METINIVFTIDNNYAQFLGVTLCSLFENKKEGYLIDIYIIDGGISEENKEKLKILENKYNFKINYIKIDTSFFENFMLNTYFTQAVYYRIMIPQILSNFDKILYLDCDIIILNDIYELYKINIDNFYIGAAEETVVKKTRHAELEIPLTEKYFNAGVLLINIKKWRDNETSEKIIKFIKNNPDKLKFCDQDALNASLQNKWLEIHSKYNFMASLFDNYLYKYEELGENITIIHYTGLKPWNYLYTHPYAKKYFYYLKKTPWKNSKYINKNLKNMFLRYFKIFVYYLFSHSLIEHLKKIKTKMGVKFY